MATKRNVPETVALPCKIGDRVWAIRNNKGILIPQKGIVREMFFDDGVNLVICVKHIARGLWGKTVFATKAEAEAEITERKVKQK